MAFIKGEFTSLTAFPFICPGQNLGYEEDGFTHMMPMERYNEFKIDIYANSL